MPVSTQIRKAFVYKVLAISSAKNQELFARCETFLFWKRQLKQLAGCTETIVANELRHVLREC